MRRALLLSMAACTGSAEDPTGSISQAVSDPTVGAYYRFEEPDPATATTATDSGPFGYSLTFVGAQLGSPAPIESSEYSLSVYQNNYAISGPTQEPTLALSRTPNTGLAALTVERITLDGAAISNVQLTGNLSANYQSAEGQLARSTDRRYLTTATTLTGPSRTIVHRLDLAANVVDTAFPLFASRATSVFSTDGGAMWLAYSNGFGDPSSRIAWGNSASPTAPSNIYTGSDFTVRAAPINDQLWVNTRLSLATIGTGFPTTPSGISAPVFSSFTPNDPQRVTAFTGLDTTPNTQDSDLMAVAYVPSSGSGPPRVALWNIAAGTAQALPTFSRNDGAITALHARVDQGVYQLYATWANATQTSLYRLSPPWEVWTELRNQTGTAFRGLAPWPKDDPLDLTDEWTLSFWTLLNAPQINAPQQAAPLMGKAASCSDRQWEIRVGRLGSFVHFYWANGTQFSDIGTLPNSFGWNHIAIKYGPASPMRFYVNGVLRSTTTGQYRRPATTTPFKLGSPCTTTTTFSASIDDLRVYTRQLSDAEIAARGTVPGTPSLNSAQALSPTSASLAWSTAPNATKYFVYRQVWGSDEPATFVTTVTGTTATITHLTQGATYGWYVRAGTAGGVMSDYSNTRTTTHAAPPAAPTVTASFAPSGRIRLTWTSVPNASKYYVYRSVDGSPLAYLGTVTATTTDIPVTPATAYTFTVRAVTPTGTTADSAPVSITTP